MIFLKKCEPVNSAHALIAFVFLVSEIIHANFVANPKDLRIHDIVSANMYLSE